MVQRVTPRGFIETRCHFFHQTRFRLIPQRVSAHKAQVTPREPPRPTTRSGVRALLRPRRLLLVEDDTLVARSVTRVLRREGHDLTVVTSVKEALEQLGPFDLGIFDVELGDGDGLTLARRLLDRASVMRAIFFTSLSTPSVIAIASERGAYLNKSEGGRQLAQLVGELLDAAPAEVVNGDPKR